MFLAFHLGVSNWSSVALMYYHRGVATVFIEYAVRSGFSSVSYCARVRLRSLVKQPLLCCFAWREWRCFDVENLAESRFMPIMKMHFQKKHMFVDGVTV